ncbi:hypothetical protein U0070_007838, partial [Myodes glareolus]
MQGDQGCISASSSGERIVWPSEPPAAGSPFRHVVPRVGGVGVEEARLFWVLRIASSSSSLSSQLLQRRCTPPRGAGTRGAWDQSLGARGAGDAGAAGDTCGSSRWQPSPGQQQQQQRKPRQLQSLRPGQPPLLSPPLRSRSLMLLPAPGPADPGGCGSSASQQLFADCSGFQCAQLGSAQLRWGYPAGVWCWKLRPRGARLGLSPSPALQESGRLARLSATAAWGLALQIQCYQCEEFQLNNDCSSPEFIVNCTVNVQDMCQKEVMEQSAGIPPNAAQPPGLLMWHPAFKADLPCLNRNALKKHTYSMQ